MKVFATVRALLLNDSQEVLLIRRSASDPFYPHQWDLPGGRVEKGESLDDALVRETQEEVGITPSHPTLVYAASGPRAGGSGTWLFFVCRASGIVSVNLGNEHDRYMWIKFSELPNYTDYKVLLDMHAYVTRSDLISYE